MNGHPKEGLRSVSCNRTAAAAQRITSAPHIGCFDLPTWVIAPSNSGSSADSMSFAGQHNHSYAGFRAPSRRSDHVTLPDRTRFSRWPQHSAGRGAAQASAVRSIDNNAEDGVTWVHSYVTPDRKRTFCIYDGPTPEAVRRAAARNKLPISRITEVLSSTRTSTNRKTAHERVALNIRSASAWFSHDCRGSPRRKRL